LQPTYVAQQAPGCLELQTEAFINRSFIAELHKSASSKIYLPPLGTLENYFKAGYGSVCGTLES